MEKSIAHIYKITNIVSGKCYIGETIEKNPEERWRRHKETIKRGVGCPALRDAVNKYGIDKFTFEVIRECSLEERFDDENALIMEHNTQVPNGYNILPGGEGGGFLGKKHTPESIAKIKDSCKKFRDVNQNHFETYREKLAEAMKKVDTGAAVKKSEAFQKAKEEGRVGSANWKTTKTDEEREAINKKISQTLKDNYKQKKYIVKVVGIKINQYSLDNNLIATHDSIREAARAINKTSRYSITQAIDSETRTAYGFKWKTCQPKE